MNSFERPDDTRSTDEEIEVLHARIEYLHTVMTDSGEAQTFRAQIRAAEDRINELGGYGSPELEPLPDDEELL